MANGSQLQERVGGCPTDPLFFITRVFNRGAPASRRILWPKLIGPGAMCIDIVTEMILDGVRFAGGEGLLYPEVYATLNVVR